MRTVAVVQARLGSTRLPRKVLADLAGKPMLERIVERVRRAHSVDDVVVSTSDAVSDDDIVSWAASRSVLCTRAPVDDIVTRLLRAARASSADRIVRVWGDCPFVDAGCVDAMVELATARSLDFISNGLPGTRTFPPGFDAEIYTLALLERMDAEIADGFLREFPFDFVRGHAAELRIAEHHAPSNLANLHFTVDYPEDLAAARRLFEVLGPDASFGLDDVLAACRKDPTLLAPFEGRARNADYRAKVAARGSDS